MLLIINQQFIFIQSIMLKKKDSGNELDQSRNIIGVTQPQLRGSSSMIFPAPKGSQAQLTDQTYYPLGSKSEQQLKDYMGVNQILVHRFKQNKPNYFVPTYLRMKINRVNLIDYLQSKAEIVAEIRIWLMIKDFPKVVQEQIINQAKLNISQIDQIQFQNIREPSKLDSNAIRNKSKLCVGFLFFGQMQLNIESNPFWSPFQLIKMIADLEIRKIVLGNGNPQFEKRLTQKQKQLYLQAGVQFNFIDSHPFLQFSFRDVRHLGSFDIAQQFVDMKFSNQAIRDQDQDLMHYDIQDLQGGAAQHVDRVLKLRQKIKMEKLRSGQTSPDAFEHGQIIIPLYKFPSSTIINIFVPLYTVAIINLGVFFQLNQMTGRIQNLAAFLLAYVAFLPTIRENLPNTPKIVFTEILVYIQICCTLICFFYSIYLYGNDTMEYHFQWDQQPPFLTCVVLTILNMCVIITMLVLHKLVWQRKYNTLPSGSSKYINSKHLNTDDNQQWYNDDCEQEFSYGFKVGVIKPFVCRKRKDRVDRKNQEEVSELGEGKYSLIYKSVRNNETEMKERPSN